MKTTILVTATFLAAHAIPFARAWLARAPWRRGLPLFSLLFTLASFELSPTSLAVTPPQDGGYGVQNAAEGTDPPNVNSRADFHFLGVLP